MPTPPTVPRGDGTASYIVVFRPNVTQTQILSFIGDVKGQGATVNHTYTNVFKGFSARMKPAYMRSLRAHNLIEYIEPDQIVTISPISHRPQTAESKK